MKTEKKHCTDCSKAKTLDQFTRRQTKCRQCMVVRATKWRRDNKEKYNTYQREYQRKHARL